MNRRLVVLVVGLVLVAGAAGVLAGKASAAPGDGPRYVDIHPSFGTFKGTRGNDLVFEHPTTKTIYIVELFEHGENGKWVLTPKEKVQIRRR